MMMMDLNHDDDADSDRTESYTPPPLDITNELNISSEKENNHQKNSSLHRRRSIIVLDDSFHQVTISKENDHEPNHYWDQWPLANDQLDDDEERLKLYSIPDIDIPPSPPSRQSISQTSTSTASNILDILTRPSSLPHSNQSRNTPAKKPPLRRKKKKKPMSEYRPPSPFSPKPDYKSMDIEQIKKHAMKYGLSTTQSKTRLIKILDEIYNVTHQYETDTDYEFDSNEVNLPKEKALSHTPPTPAIVSERKKPKKRPAVHQMSSSDDISEHSPPPAKRPTPTTTADNENNDESDDDDDANHEGRFLELTVYDLSSSVTSSSSSLSNTGTPPTHIANNSPSKQSPMETTSQSSTTKTSKSTPILTTDSKAKPSKKPKLQTPTIPLKEIVRDYIESNPTLHARILCYEPIDFEEFHKQMKTDLNLKIVSKELMQCLDDQCITFTLRSRKGAFTSVMRAKRRNK